MQFAIGFCFQNEQTLELLVPCPPYRDVCLKGLGRVLCHIGLVGYTARPPHRNGAYGTGRQKEEDRKTFVCDKRDKAIPCVFCRDLYLLLCSCPV